MKIRSLVALLAVSVAACGQDDLPVASQVDLQQFQGKWHEIAHLPRPTQRDCTGTIATYTTRPDGTLTLAHECTLTDGSYYGKTAIATVRDPQTPAKLAVNFGGYTGDYWILEVAPDYRYAVVGHPSRDYLWILSRTPELAPADKEAALAKAKQTGFDVSLLEYTPAAPEPQGTPAPPVKYGVGGCSAAPADGTQGGVVGAGALAGVLTLLLARRRRGRVLGGVALGAFAGCYTGPHIDPAYQVPATAGPTSTSADPGTGIPCDLSEVLTRACDGCHGVPLSGGAPNRLLSLEDLAVASKSDPTRSVAELAIARMRDTAKPMPPAGASPEADVAVLESWVAAGMPAGTCATDPGTTGVANTPLVCTSGTTWTRRNHGSQLMHPGGKCIDCHSSEEDAPRYVIAGTVYPTVHEPDDCNGAAGNARVVITGADGKTVELAVNAAGNFATRTAIALPYRAKVVVGTQTRAMQTPQTEGECNGCHTSVGAEKAPGRVMLP